MILTMASTLNLMTGLDGWKGTFTRTKKLEPPQTWEARRPSPAPLNSSLELLILRINYILLSSRLRSGIFNKEDPGWKFKHL